VATNKTKLTELGTAVGLVYDPSDAWPASVETLTIPGIPDAVWRPVAVAAALVSIAGITVFFGTWPMFNTFAALAVDVAVLAAVLWLRWPSAGVLGN
jgi:hypothetical protein